MSSSTAINPAKKTWQAVNWAVNKVSAAHGWAIQKMGGAIAVTGAILAAVSAYGFNTIGKAMDWLEAKLAAGIPIAVGFLIAKVGAAEKWVLRRVLENLT